eukprot:3286203-Prymnesium_polylepis.1
MAFALVCTPGSRRLPPSPGSSTTSLPSGLNHFRIPRNCLKLAITSSTPSTSGSAPAMYSSNHSSFWKHSRDVPLVLAKPLASS